MPSFFECRFLPDGGKKKKEKVDRWFCKIEVVTFFFAKLNYSAENFSFFFVVKGLLLFSYFIYY